MYRRCILAIVAVFLFPNLPASAATAAPAVASPEACSSTAPEAPHDLPAAFAYELDSPTVLHFLTLLAAAPPSRQKRIFDAAVAAASTAPEKSAQAAASAGCPDPDALYGAARASYLTVNLWKLSEFSDVARFQAFLGVLATAVAATSTNDRLTPDDRGTALLPFIDLAVGSQTTPEPTAATCARPNVPARDVHSVQPEYPSTATLNGTLGTVRVLVSLSDTGDVRSARAVADPIVHGAGWQDIVRGSIFAAAASTYAPRIEHCLPVAGSYVFKAQYAAR